MTTRSSFSGLLVLFLVTVAVSWATGYGVGKPKPSTPETPGDNLTTPSAPAKNFQDVVQSDDTSHFASQNSSFPTGKDAKVCYECSPPCYNPGFGCCEGAHPQCCQVNGACGCCRF